MVGVRGMARERMTRKYPLYLSGSLYRRLDVQYTPQEW